MMKKTALALVVVVVLAGAAAAQAGGPVAKGQERTQPAPGAAAEFDPAHADVAALRARRAELAGKAYDMAVARLQAGMGTVDNVIAWAVRWRDAEAALDARAAAVHNAERARKLEPMIRDRVNAGAVGTDALLAVQWWRADAELALR